MTSAAQTVPLSQENPADASAPAASADIPPEGWEALRAGEDIQFAPVEIPDLPEPEPTWFSRAIEALFDFLGMIIQPVARLVVDFWWIAAILAAALAVFFLARLYGPLARAPRAAKGAPPEAGAPDWRPEESESLALLEDADRLAAEGRYDEATHLLLLRSVGQIAAARPDWVEPSSTARELASLPALPDAARTAFAAVAERVERSLFALRALDRADWEAARAAYADFALQRISAP
ncbi:hypothetical protein [Erythrobacter sp.]|uniref:hypothetical protein n=1 Tax=Erythrobacter sp. TaxID=1042 RepID=UPI0025BA1313|nr:hypothetical protein [Erythrobacter sp.]